MFKYCFVLAILLAFTNAQSSGITSFVWSEKPQNFVPGAGLYSVNTLVSSSTVNKFYYVSGGLASASLNISNVGLLTLTAQPSNFGAVYDNNGTVTVTLNGSTISGIINFTAVVSPPITSAITFSANASIVFSAITIKFLINAVPGQALSITPNVTDATFTLTANTTAFTAANYAALVTTAQTLLTNNITSDLKAFLLPLISSNINTTLNTVVNTVINNGLTFTNENGTKFTYTMNMTVTQPMDVTNGFLNFYLDGDVVLPPQGILKKAEQRVYLPIANKDGLRDDYNYSRCSALYLDLIYQQTAALLDAFENNVLMNANLVNTLSNTQKKYIPFTLFQVIELYFYSAAAQAGVQNNLYGIFDSFEIFCLKGDINSIAVLNASVNGSFYNTTGSFGCDIRIQSSITGNITHFTTLNITYNLILQAFYVTDAINLSIIRSAGVDPVSITPTSISVTQGEQLDSNSVMMRWVTSMFNTFINLNSIASGVAGINIAPILIDTNTYAMVYTDNNFWLCGNPLLIA